MRCEPILRELDAPTGALEPADLAEHLATCATCAEWADRTRQFDRIWDATRPAEPSKAVWDGLWSEISRKAGTPRPLLATIWPPAGPRRVRFFAVTGLAQAAALLIAGLVAFRGDHGGVSAPKPTEMAAVVHHDEAKAGSTLFICLDAKGRRVSSESRIMTPAQYEMADVEDPIAVVWDMELINSFEGAE